MDNQVEERVDMCETPKKETSGLWMRVSALSVRSWILMAVAVVVLVGLIVGGVLLYNHARVEKVKRELAGHCYSYSESSRTLCQRIRLSFNFDAKLDYYEYYYSDLSFDFGHGMTYDDPIKTSYEHTWEDQKYEIQFEGKRVFLKVFGKHFEIDFDQDGDIISLRETTLEWVFLPN